MEKKYLRKLGVFEVTVKDVTKKEWKGQHKASFVLEDAEGNLIDLDFKLPITAQHKFVQEQFQKLLKICSAAKPTDCKGKKLAAYVAPSEWKGKVFWNVKDVFDVKMLKEQDVGLDDDFMGSAGDGADSSFSDPF